jgi:electron transport complex protein RnfD
VGDWSAVITGILLALILPPGFPLWMAAVTAIVGVGVGKMFFGGLGYNVMNPALVGRAFGQAAFTVPMTTWAPFRAEGRFTEFIPSSLTLPFLKPAEIGEWVSRVAPDGFSGATPLALMKFDQVSTDSIKMLLGASAGSAGETSALLILLCGLYLVARKFMDWRITFSVLASAALLSGVFHLVNPEIYPTPLFTLCSGGLMLGAVFMATDMVSSPVTPLGVWIYGALIGVVTVIIRLFGGLNEGVMYAILLANACAPLINSMTQPRIYGAVKPARKAA